MNIAEANFRLLEAVDNKIPELAEGAIKGGADVNLRSSFSPAPTVLHIAASKGDHEMAEVLLKNGADVNSLTKAPFPGETPLHWAASAGEKKAAQTLIDNGADVNVRDEQGKTPLDQAKDRNKTDLVALLEPLTQESHAGRAQKNKEKSGGRGA